jgi:uncharacterized repeat protein (TIGR01451 family)
VNLTVYPAPEFTISTSHVGNFAAGQTAMYTVAVANASATGPAVGPIMVTASLSSFMTLVSMSGTGWDCSTAPTCTRSDSLLAGAGYPPIAVTVSVAANAPSPQLGSATLSVTGYLDATASDPAMVTTMACDANQDRSFTVADVQAVLNQALGIDSPGNDVNVDGVVNALDIQLAVNSVFWQVCVL